MLACLDLIANIASPSDHSLQQTSPVAPKGSNTLASVMPLGAYHVMAGRASLDEEVAVVC